MQHPVFQVSLLNESFVVDTYFLYVFLKKLVTPFDKTEAFKLGIIDERGNLLKKRHTLRSTEEKKAATQLDVLVWNLKKLIEKLPFGRSKLATYAAALFLLRESDNYALYESSHMILQETFMEYAELLLLDISDRNVILRLDEFMCIHHKDLTKMLLEQTPANTVGSGAIAGASPGEQPVIRLKKGKKPKSKIIRRKENDKKIDPKVIE